MLIDSESRIINVYVDGSHRAPTLASRKIGTGGIGIVTDEFSHSAAMLVCMSSGHAEIMAIIVAMHLLNLADTPDTQYTIHTDSDEAIRYLRILQTPTDSDKIPKPPHG